MSDMTNIILNLPLLWRSTGGRLSVHCWGVLDWQNTAKSTEFDYLAVVLWCQVQMTSRLSSPGVQSQQAVPGTVFSRLQAAQSLGDTHSGSMLTEPSGGSLQSQVHEESRHSGLLALCITSFSPDQTRMYLIAPAKIQQTRQTPWVYCGRRFFARACLQLSLQTLQVENGL